MAQAAQPRMARNESASQSRQPLRRIIISEKARLSGCVSARGATRSTRLRQPGPQASRSDGMTLGGNMISVFTYMHAPYTAVSRPARLLAEIIERPAGKINRQG